MKNKKMNIILSMLVLVLLWGCSGTTEFEKDIPLKDLGVPIEHYILKNYEYFNICESKYQDFKLIENGTYQCEHNGIKITMNKLSEQGGLAELNYTFSKDIKDADVLKEINIIFKSNKLSEMNQKQYNQLKSKGSKRVFNGMGINYGVDEKTNNDYIYITGRKLTGDYPQENYLN
ncbi:MAG: hypothetical protein LBT75_03610 [Bacilli bacterium]|jgi:uncharacterized protein YjaZ|nr:hypothetical protein [Bacilli bacterium]